MDDGRDQAEELTLEPVTVVRSRRPRALWAVLAAVAVAAGALVVTSAAEDGGQRPGLPVALGASVGQQEGVGAADSMLAWVSYVPGDDLPALGGEAAAYRLRGSVSEEQVRALADALGVEGDIVHDGPGWTVSGADGTLEVYESGGAQWWYSAQGGGGSSGSAGAGACTAPAGSIEPECTVTTFAPPPECTASDGPAECITGECATEGALLCVEPAPCPPGTRCNVSQECPDHAECAPTTTVACGTDGRLCPEDIGAPPPDADCATAFDPACPDDTAGPPSPADLPSEDEARAIALDLLAATGLDVDDAIVTTDGPYDAWYVGVEPRLDGVPSGLLANVAVGSAGKVVSAGGYLDEPERLGDYPLLDTRAAIERANSQTGDVPITTIPADPGGTTGGDTVVTAGTVVGDECEACEPIDDGPVTTVVSCPDGASDCGGTGGVVGAPATSTTFPQPCKVQPDGREICELEGTGCTAGVGSTGSCPGGEPCIGAETSPGASTATTVCELPVCPQAAPPDDVPVGAPESIDCAPPVPGPEPQPLPEPSPIEVVLVDAEPALILLGAIDGSTDAYLVPAYRFTDADGGRVDLPAVADDVLITPITTETTVAEPPVLPDPPGTEPIDPQPCREVLVEEDPSGTTHTIQPDPACEPQPERVDLILHCMVIVDWQGLWWNTEQVNAAEGWVGTGSITQEKDGTATYVDDGAPDEPTTFVAQGASDTYPGCD